MNHPPPTPRVVVAPNCLAGDHIPRAVAAPSVPGAALHNRPQAHPTPQEEARGHQTADSPPRNAQAAVAHHNVQAGVRPWAYLEAAYLDLRPPASSKTEEDCASPTPMCSGLVA